MTPRARWCAAAAAPCLVFLALTLPWVHAVPIWDGMYYFECVLRATRAPYPIGAFACADHPPGYLMLAGWPQYLFHGSAVALNLANIGWMLVAIAGVLRLAHTLAGEDAPLIEKAVVAVVFATAPLVVATTCHFCADEGLLVFYPWAIDGVFRGRYLQSFIAGTGLMLSKEPGLALYGIAWLVVLLPDVPRILRGEGRRELQRAFALLLPFGAVGLYLLVRQLGGSDPFNRESVLQGGFGQPAGYLIVLLLNFTWVIWAVPLAAHALSGLRPSARPALALGGRAVQLGLIFLLDVLVLTRAMPFEIPRYYVAAFVPLLLFSWLLLRKSAPGTVRLGFLGLVVGLQLFANYATVDPVSIAAFGASDYGGMSMHCRYWDKARGCWGRDQLVYNQQFLEIQAAQNAVFRKLRPGSDATFLVGRYANYLMHGPLDPETFARTEEDGDVVKPRFVTLEDLAGDDTDPPTLYVLYYPRLGTLDLSRLSRRYETVAKVAYGTGRYRIQVTTLRRVDSGGS